MTSFAVVDDNRLAFEAVGQLTTKMDNWITTFATITAAIGTLVAALATWRAAAAARATATVAKESLDLTIRQENARLAPHLEAEKEIATFRDIKGWAMTLHSYGGEYNSIEFNGPFIAASGSSGDYECSRYTVPAMKGRDLVMLTFPEGIRFGTITVKIAMRGGVTFVRSYKFRLNGNRDLTWELLK